jgi:16S rRNA (uracil1498-N3)-methyltransferase
VNLFYQPLLPQGVNNLNEEESRHCVKVLRGRPGDSITITDGAGTFYQAVVKDANPSRCTFVVTSQTSESKRDFRIHIAIAPAKNPDRIEWFVEKCSELGIDKITFIRTEHTEKIFLKQDRLLKVAISAMKQSLKATLPHISDVIPMTDLINQADEDQKFIAHVDETNPLHLINAARRGGSSLVLIGPEGDFSADEVSAATALGFLKVSLGKSRLRTETAGVAACHILNLVNS